VPYEDIRPKDGRMLSLYIVVDNYTDGESVESYQSSPVCPDGRLLLCEFYSFLNKVQCDMSFSVC